MLYTRQLAGWKSKINNSSTAEFELWRNAGPSAFQLKEQETGQLIIIILYYAENAADNTHNT